MIKKLSKERDGAETICCITGFLFVACAIIFSFVLFASQKLSEGHYFALTMSSIAGMLCFVFFIGFLVEYYNSKARLKKWNKAKESKDEDVQTAYKEFNDDDDEVKELEMKLAKLRLTRDAKAAYIEILCK